MGLFVCALVSLLVKLHSLKIQRFILNLTFVFYRMAPRTSTPPQPSSEMNQIVRVIDVGFNSAKVQEGGELTF